LEEGGVKVAAKMPQVGDGVEDIVFKTAKYSEEDETKFRDVLKKLKIEGTEEETNAQLRKLLILPN
jgi:hypothetical protein